MPARHITLTERIARLIRGKGANPSIANLTKKPLELKHGKIKVDEYDMRLDPGLVNKNRKQAKIDTEGTKMTSPDEKPRGSSYVQRHDEPSTVSGRPQAPETRGVKFRLRGNSTRVANAAPGTTSAEPPDENEFLQTLGPKGYVRQELSPQKQGGGLPHATQTDFE